MKKPDYLILLCNSYRMVGEAKGTCLKRGSSDLIQYLTEEAADRGLDVAVTNNGLFKYLSTRASNYYST